GVVNALGPMNTRDSIMGFTMHGLGICKTEGVEQRERRGLGGVIAWALLVACVIGGSSALYCKYSYPTPAAENTVPARNYFGAERMPIRELGEPMDYYQQRHW